MAITKVTRTLLSTGIVDNSNATAITIDSSENVGIGTGSPSGGAVGGKVLHLVNSGGTASVRVDRSDSTTAGTISLLDANSTHGLYGTGSKPMAFSTNSTERMRIDSSGNVGIGATPKAYHSDYKAIDINNSASVMGYTGNNGAWLMENLYYGTDNNWKHKNSDFSALVGMYDGVFNFYNTASGTAGATATLQNRLKIDQSGNVGIGTDSPSEKLSILGGHVSVGDSTGANGTEFLLEGYREIYNAAKYGNTSIRTTYSTTTNASDMLFYTASGGTNTAEAMRIDSSGNVGIGTSDPKEFCDINGGGLIVRGALTNGVDSGNGLRFEHTSDIGQIYSLEPNVAWRELRLNASQQTFYIAGGEKMRIDSSGRVMVNQTAASAASAGVKMQVNTDILSRGTFAGYFWENRSGITIGSLTGWGGWYSTGTSVHSLYSDGNNIVSINRSSGAYTALSDKNKKKDFEDSTVGLTEVMQLQPKKFRMIDDADDAPKKLGFVAQDVENIIPEAYFEDTNEDASGVESTFIGLTDRPIIAALTKAIQEQQTIIDNLKTRIETLENV
jgi:hypothetical protein